MKLDYNSKIEMCKKLGAKRFQKLVFKVESFKWIIIKRLIPNYIKYGDLFIKYNANKKLKKANTKNEKDIIKRNAMMQKMFLRKEYNNNKNMNYHIDVNNPSKFIRELYMNKNIHKKSLILNLILLPILTILAMLGCSITIPIAAYEIFSIFINFECINIQNYNIYRIKKIEEKLKSKEKKIEDNKIEQFRNAYEVIGKTLEENKDFIDVNKLVEKIQSKEELLQLKELIKIEKVQRQYNNIIKEKKQILK